MIVLHAWAIALGGIVPSSQRCPNALHLGKRQKCWCSVKALSKGDPHLTEYAIQRQCSRNTRPVTLLTSTHAIAWVLVHSLAVWIAAGSSSFHRWATSLAKGSSGFGAPRRAWIDSRIVRICKAGDQLPAHSQSREMSPDHNRGHTLEYVQAYSS